MDEQNEIVRAIVFDRDGTLIKHVPYLSDPQKVELFSGVAQALKLARDRGVRLFLHTNQSGVGRGMYELSAVHACNQRMIELLELGDNLFEEIRIAPESPDKPGQYRKPSPIFAQEIMGRYQLSPQQVCYIGDRGSDLQTAHNAGTLGIGLTTGLGDLSKELDALGLGNQYPIFDCFESAMRHVLDCEQLRPAT